MILGPLTIREGLHLSYCCHPCCNQLYVFDCNNVPLSLMLIVFVFVFSETRLPQSSYMLIYCEQKAHLTFWQKFLKSRAQHLPRTCRLKILMLNDSHQQQVSFLDFQMQSWKLISAVSLWDYKNLFVFKVKSYAPYQRLYCCWCILQDHNRHVKLANILKNEVHIQTRKSSSHQSPNLRSYCISNSGIEYLFWIPPSKLDFWTPRQAQHQLGVQKDLKDKNRGGRGGRGGGFHKNKTSHLHCFSHQNQLARVWY